MKRTEQQTKSREFLLSIYKKAWEDEKFKQSLIKNPVETLNEFTGKVVDFPKDKKLIVQDQSNSNHVHINIPPKPNLEDLELNEDQLEMVAGGSIWDTIVECFEKLTNDETISDWSNAGVL